MRGQRLVALLLSVASPAHAADPDVPDAQDPGGIAIAILTTGIDYTVPEIAKRLARDGEGEIVGWDLVDNDNRPFDAVGDGTALAKILAESGVRLIPVRIDPKDAAQLVRAVAFVSRTPARIVVVPFASGTESEWRLFGEAARRVSELLFVVAAGGSRAFALDNVVTVAPGGTVTAPPADAVIEGTEPGQAAVRAVAALFCKGATLDAVSGRARKVEFLSKVAGGEAVQPPRVIAPCPK
jgi:subtilisin family serine protease